MITNGTRLTGCCFLVVALAACRVRIGGETTVEAENMRLRTENRALAKAAESSELARAESESKLAQIVGGTSADARASEVMAAIPRLTRVVISNNSCIDREGVAHIFIECEDGRARAMQVVGELHIDIVDDQDAVIATRGYSPLQLREAYRTGPFGAHYLAELKVESQSQNVTARVKFTELPVPRVFETKVKLGRRK